MYDYIKGSIGGKYHTQKGSFITVEACGIGYLCEVTKRDYELVDGENIKLYTVLIHREDTMTLCGFIHKEARDIFNILTSVSGVGSKMALTLLNEFDYSKLIAFVIEGNYKELTRAKGVGPKLAQKIILELKDKLINYQDKEPIVIENNNSVDSQAMADAQAVLSSLGYGRDEIQSAMSKAVVSLETTASAEDILKKTLQILSI